MMARYVSPPSPGSLPNRCHHFPASACLVCLRFGFSSLASFVLLVRDGLLGGGAMDGDSEGEGEEHEGKGGECEVDDDNCYEDCEGDNDLLSFLPLSFTLSLSTILIIIILVNGNDDNDKI